MKRVLSQFKENIERVRNLHATYKILSIETTDAIDFSDLLRAELVLVVSAIDYYIHEIVRVGMLEVFQGKRTETPSFKNFNVSSILLVFEFIIGSILFVIFFDNLSIIFLIIF